MIKLHPIWKHAGDEIARRVSRDGYGFLIEIDELYNMFMLDQPTNDTPFGAAKAVQFEFMAAIENLKEYLLPNYSIYLQNERAKGYRVMMPDDQVSAGFERCMAKARKYLSKSIGVVRHVDSGMLSTDGMATRDRNLNRAMFAAKAMTKRRIPQRDALKIKG